MSSDEFRPEGSGDFDQIPEPELHARSSDPGTSHDSMAAYDRDRMKSASMLVIELHQRHGPMALFELEPLFAEAFQRPHAPNLPRQARRTAGDRGKLHNTGRRKLNPATNCEGEVWEYGEGPAPEIHRCPACGGLLKRNLPPAPE